MARHLLKDFSFVELLTFVDGLFRHVVGDLHCLKLLLLSESRVSAVFCCCPTAVIPRLLSHSCLGS